jgi:hypothetical protein
MTKIKTSELDGAALDWAVAKCEKLRLSGASLGFLVKKYGRYAVRHEGRGACYCPTENWSQGGRIIEREGIFFSPLPDNGIRAYIFRDGQYLYLTDCWGYDTPITRLIVAMRCYVASKLGDEVEVPDELIGGPDGPPSVSKEV